MPPMDTHARHDSIRSSIMRRTGPLATAAMVAHASLQMWLRMAAQREPVIGARGVDALFGRALHLTGRTYPWLCGPGLQGGSASALELVRQRLEQQAPGAAMGAACALLESFIELLATLIGESLAHRLLAPAWEPPCHGLRTGDCTMTANVTIRRLPTGVPGLDAILGGRPAGVLLQPDLGAAGAGKTVLASEFLVTGVVAGEPGVMVAFEQTRSQSLNPTIDDLVRSGHIGLINTRSLDLSIDEIVHRLIHRIRQLKARRVVIDSLTDFELAVAPSFRDDFRESLFRMVAALSGLGVTVLLTYELQDHYTDLRFSAYGSAFMTDAIIVQRYIEIDSQFRRVMAVVKVRGGPHSSDIRQYRITEGRTVIGERILDHDGLLAGQPRQRTDAGHDEEGRR